MQLRLTAVFAGMAILVASSAGIASAPREEQATAVMIRRVYGFTPSDFAFAVVVPDDLQGPAGGWQKSTVKPLFRDARSGTEINWTCTVDVGMPLRTEADGEISSSRARRLSARAANAASDAVMATRPTWLPAAFCPLFGAAMEAILKKSGASGARVTSKHP